MYKIIKETINSNGNVIESVELGIYDVYNVKSLTKLANVINTNYIINGSDNRCRFKIVKLNILSQDSLEIYIKEHIKSSVDNINRIIKYKNCAATVSAKRANKNKVQLLKELRLEDYLYPIRLEVRLVESASGLLVE